MTVLIVEPGKVPRRAEIGEDLSSMQEVVGGPIQAVYPFEEPVALVCHEEGKLLNLPKNRFLTGEDGLVYDVVMGTFFICSALANSENFESLTEEQIARYHKMFLTPDFVEKKGTPMTENFTTRFLFALGGEIILTNIWCYFFIDGAETNIKEKLKIIRPIVSLSEPDDIALYNYWAQKVCIELIKVDKDS